MKHICWFFGGTVNRTLILPVVLFGFSKLPMANRSLAKVGSQETPPEPPLRIEELSKFSVIHVSMTIPCEPGLRREGSGHHTAAGRTALPGTRLWWCLAILLSCLTGQVGVGAELDTARGLYREGKYSETAAQAAKQLEKNDRNEDWRVLQLESFLAEGKYPEAFTVVTNAQRRFGSSLRLRWLSREIFLKNNQPELAQEATEEIVRLGSQRWLFREAGNLVVLGRIALLSGADPKTVLDSLYDRARQMDPENRDAWLASGELALAKGDHELAAKTFQNALKKFTEDPDLHAGLARAFAPSQRMAMLESIEKALEINPRHVPSLVLVAEHAIDAEEYEEASKQLKDALAVNPHSAEALALSAVLKHLKYDLAGEEKDRSAALRYGTNNPAVDHLIGKKLSQKYRFKEGAAAQRRALEMDPGFLPAKAQLAQDLLRLGEEKEGWNLADEVHEKDGYDVTAFNLVNLHDVIKKFQTLTNENFVVRMEAKEADLYGKRVLEVLQFSFTNLCTKYNVRPPKPVVVEIFPDQKDFGVRTFGMPENPGFLGVCFGPVITANSPATQRTGKANWHAVLYHEFCHVLTLQLTKNRMPRWLSEGISVHEERLQHPGWGQQMTESYRERILTDRMKPVAEMSAAFLTSKTGEDMQFAYFQSSLVVDFLVQEYGHPKLLQILADLGDGVWINDAIAKRTAPMPTLEKQFKDYAKKRAMALAPGLDFREPAVPGLEKPDAKIAAQYPTNLMIQRTYILSLLDQKKFAEAKEPLKRLADLHPTHTGPDSALLLLARVHRSLGETNEERLALEKLARVEADDTDSFSRLMELSSKSGDHPAVRLNAARILQVNPAASHAHRALAESSELTSNLSEAVEAWRTLLKLDPPDPADVHYRLARVLHTLKDPAARRHVLLALEEAPRYRDAQKLLLEIVASPRAEGTQKATNLQ